MRQNLGSCTYWTVIHLIRQWIKLCGDLCFEDEPIYICLFKDISSLFLPLTGYTTSLFFCIQFGHKFQKKHVNLYYTYWEHHISIMDVNFLLEHHISLHSAKLICTNIWIMDAFFNLNMEENQKLFEYCRY